MDNKLTNASDDYYAQGVNNFIALGAWIDAKRVAGQIKNLTRREAYMQHITPNLDALCIRLILKNPKNIEKLINEISSPALQDRVVLLSQQLYMRKMDLLFKRMWGYFGMGERYANDADAIVLERRYF